MKWLMQRSREMVRTFGSTWFCVLFDSPEPVPHLSAAAGMEVEMENRTNRSNSDSKEPLTLDLQEPAPQKKKKKKKASTIGIYTLSAFTLKNTSAFLFRLLKQSNLKTEKIQAEINLKLTYLQINSKVTKRIKYVVQIFRTEKLSWSHTFEQKKIEKYLEFLLKFPEFWINCPKLEQTGKDIKIWLKHKTVKNSICQTIIQFLRIIF